jgi:hypothetical protein
MKRENLELATSVIKGAAAALDMISSEELVNLEQTELFQALTSHNLAQLHSDVSSYVNALKQVKEIMDRNGGELPSDDPSIKQQLIDLGMIGQGSGGDDDIEATPQSLGESKSKAYDNTEFDQALIGAVGFNPFAL